MYRNEILNGINFLKSIQNADGGIPGIKETGVSACWTTAEALETVLLSPYISMEHHNFIFKMIEFLLNTQMNAPNNINHDGAWPEYVSTNIAQTLTTGHALSALKLAEGIIVDDKQLQNRIQTAIKKGFDYLDKIQNSDGGWGIEPEGSGEEKESRPFGTIFVLRGYIQNGYNSNNSKVVRDACNYLKNLRDIKSGGFSKKPNEEPDICCTARVISVFIKSKTYNTNDPIIKTALKFIFNDKSLKSLFKIKHDPYVSENSSGMVVFHSNTPIDVIEALCLCRIQDRRMHKLLKWIVQTQEDKGGWYLGGTRDPQINEGVISWTTNEAIYALICADKAFSNEYYERYKKRLKFYKKVIFTLLFLLVILLFMPSILSSDNALVTLWNTFTPKVKEFIAITVLSGLVINLFSSTIYDWIKKLFKIGDNN